MVQSKLDFERMEMSTQEAKKFFVSAGQPFKVELINDIEKFGTTKADEILSASQQISESADQLTSRPADKLAAVSLYKTGKFTDLCRGGHGR